MKKKRTETTSETTTLLFLKNSADGERKSWCDQCAAKVFWLAPTEINLFGISDLAETDAWHTNGEFICSRSLINQLKKGEKL